MVFWNWLTATEPQLGYPMSAADTLTQINLWESQVFSPSILP
jgi:hypothetical protein